MGDETHFRHSYESTNGVFECEEETSFYQTAVQNLCFPRLSPTDIVVEVGTGTGSAVIAAMLTQNPLPTVISYEVCHTAYSQAQANVAAAGLEDHYLLRHGDFFAHASSVRADWLMTDPPYLPAPDDRLILPSLWGGPRGNSVAKDLVSLGYPNYMIVLSSYSDPVDSLNHIAACGYKVVYWLGVRLGFGRYTRESKVWDTIMSMREKQIAFFDDDGYRVAAVVLNRIHGSDNSKAVLQFLSTI